MKKILFLLPFALLLMSFSDEFTDDDGTGLETHDVNWTSIGGAYVVTNMEINSNVVEHEATWQYSGAYYNLSNSDSVQCVFPADGIAGLRQVGVRIGSNQRGYSVTLGSIVGSDYTSCDINANGDFCASSNVAGTWAVASPHTMKIKITNLGTTPDTALIETWVDDVKQTDKYHPNEDNTNTVLAAGHPGIWVGEAGNVAYSRFDNFDDLSGGATPDSFDLDTGLVFDGSSDGSPTATGLRLETGEIDTVASNPVEGSQCDSIVCTGDVSGASSTTDDSVFLTMTENFVCSLFYSEIPPVIDSCEQLNQLMIRKTRKAAATWGPDSFEYSDNYLWRQEGVWYTDTTTGHLVHKMTNSSELLSISQDDISVSPWNADGSKYMFLSERETNAYTESEGRRWFIVNTDGSLCRTAIKTPVADDGRNSYPHWCEQQPNICYDFWYDADNHDAYNEYDLMKCIVSDTAESSFVLLTFPSTHGTLLKLNKSLSSDGRTVMGMPLDESWQYPATVYPQGSAALLDVDGYTVDRGLSTDWGGTITPYTAFHDQFLKADGDWFYIMQSGASAFWWIKLLGSAADGGPQYSFTEPDIFDEEWPVSENPGPNLWGCEYWVHPAIDPWGRKVAYGNGELGLLGGCGIWDVQRKADDTASYRLGYQHGDWRFSDFCTFSYGTGDNPGHYEMDHIMVASWNKVRPIDTVCFTHTLWNNGGIYAGADYEYNATTRPSSSPDGTKSLFHSTFLQSKTGSYDDNPDIFIAVNYFPYPPTDLEAAEAAGDSIDIKFLPPRYTQRGWPYASASPTKDAAEWPTVTGADSLEVGEPCYAREIDKYRIWRSADGSTGWSTIGTVEAQYSSTYPGSADSLMLHPIVNGVKVSATNPIRFRLLPGDGTYYYAITSVEHSRIESDSLSEILEVTVSSGTISAQSIHAGSGTTGWWTTSPPKPENVRYVDETPAGMFTIYWDVPAGDSLIMRYDIYYAESSEPAIDQRNLIASISGETVFRDFLAQDGTPHYSIVSVDAYGNRSDSVLVNAGTRLVDRLLTVVDSGNGVSNIDGTVFADSGRGTLIKAYPDSGYHFVCWKTVSGTVAYDDSTLSTAACTLTTDNVVIRGLFEINTDTFYIDTSYNSGCSIAFLSAIDSIFEGGETCSLELVVDVNYIANWNGGNDIGSYSGETRDTLTFAVTSNINIVAVARAWPQYTVDSTVVNGIPDSVVFSDYGTVDSGITITVIIHNPADTQCTVSGDTSGILTGFSDVVNANKSYSFTFDEIPATEPPTVTTHPAQLNDSLGETDTVRVVASGGGTLSYQWQFWGGSWTDTSVTNDSLFYYISFAKSGDSCRCIVTNDYGADTSTAFEIAVNFSPVVIDSIRPNPNYGNDSCTIYLKSARGSGVVHIVSPIDTVLTPKYYSDTQIDFYTGAWERGWYDIMVQNSLGLKDTSSLRIAKPRKTN